MTITLQDFAAGDTNYVAKLNSNNDVLESSVGALQATVTGAASSTLSLTAAYAALFGSSVALIGAGSYEPSGSGSDLTVQDGFVYLPSTGAVVRKATSTTISFSGQPADTYYIVVDANGEPSRTDDATGAIYSVVWNGSAFGTITRLAAVVWGAEDWVAAQTSSALGDTFDSLDGRLEAIEALLGAVDYGSQPANVVLAGPSAVGSPTNQTPQFRALVQADLPAQPYDVGGTYPGVPAASAVLIRYPFPRAVVFPSGLTNSRGVAAVAATAQTDFDIQKNGASVGTMRYAAAGTTATFIMASQTSFAAGDILTVVAPGTPDATLADVGFSLAGTR